MDLTVFLCHAPADGECARAIAESLERGAGARVLLADGALEPGQTVLDRWEYGLSAAAVVLVLSPDAVPPRVRREEWAPVLAAAASASGPPLGGVLVRECAYPQLLERGRHFFRWTGDGRDTRRALVQWVVSRRPRPEPERFTPAFQPRFQGRETELERLWTLAADAPGTVVLANPAPGTGKTALAQEFARRARAHFEAVLWAGADRSPAAIVGELAAQLGEAAGGPPEEDMRRLAGWLRERRLLVVLDDAGAELPLPLPADMLASVLITSRAEACARGYALQVESAAQASPVREPERDEDRRLWQAMAICGAGGVALDLAARLAGIGEEEAGAAIARLVDAGAADPWDETGPAFRLGARSRAAALSGADVEGLRRRRAESLHAAFARGAASPADYARYLGEIAPAFEWASAEDWAMAVELARRAFAFARERGRLAEGAGILEQLREAAGARADRRVADECAWELAWIFEQWGYPPREWRALRESAEGAQLSLDLDS